MKPQDTVIFLLGEVKGEVSGLRSSVDASTSAQAAVNQANEKEHAEFRQALNDHNLAIAVLQERSPQKSPWWAIVGGLSGVLAIVFTAFSLFTSFTK